MRLLYRLLLVFCLFLAPSSSFAFDGVWQLHNQFEIGIVDGQEGGLKPADTDPLALFVFGPTHSEMDTPIPMKISMVDLRSDKVVGYDAKGIDSVDTGMIMIGVPSLDNLYIVLYLTKIDRSTYIYSYSLAFDLQNGSYISAKDSKTYIIFLGTMKRISN